LPVFESFKENVFTQFTFVTGIKKRKKKKPNNKTQNFGGKKIKAVKEHLEHEKFQLNGRQ
jgi:hypothetical protein